MPIEFALVDNQLTSDPNDHRAVIQNIKTANEADIVDDMISRGSTATKVDALAILEAYKQSVIRMVQDGRRINTELVNIGPSIRGVFTSGEDQFDPARHTVRINVTPGVRLAKAQRDLRPQKTRIGDVGPILDRFTDAASTEVDGLVSPGGAATVVGANLKIREDLEGSGIYFVKDTGEAIPAPNLIRNKPAEVIFMIPPLAAGDYALEVRTAPGNTNSLRTGRLDATLTVVG